MERTWSSTPSLLLFGDIILLLLRDEHSDIRDTISQTVQRLRCGDSGDYQASVLPSLAEEQFIDWLDQQFRPFNIADPWTVWIQLIKMQLDRNVAENEDIITDEVFDKSESNVFGEVVLVCKKLMRKVRECLMQSDGKNVEDILRSIESDWPELGDCMDFIQI